MHELAIGQIDLKATILGATIREQKQNNPKNTQIAGWERDLEDLACSRALLVEARKLHRTKREEVREG